MPLAPLNAGRPPVFTLVTRLYTTEYCPQHFGSARSLVITFTHNAVGSPLTPETIVSNPGD
ncbi:unnamed protein product [Dibothriocephalus latus]|uniref:Uncharacterized protein n=1 Tax=Dibothriocephalus latus TaxID=60516 RepID=A0A3P6QEH1_DIBLA|nr:unnamed protein product [Dibothriocephalus latus]